MKEDSEKTIQSPEQLADHLRVTYVPTYLLAAPIIRVWCSPCRVLLTLRCPTAVSCVTCWCIMATACMKGRR